MEDRYLFKAKRSDNGEWVIGNLITNVFFRLGQSIPYILCPDKAKYDCFEDFTEENGIFEVQPDTICRCTGSRDKSGNLIWEHDIAKAKYSDGLEEITEVAYSKNGYSPYLNEYECEGCCCRCEVTEIEVIGNIFDNPELLESEEQYGENI